MIAFEVNSNQRPKDLRKKYTCLINKSFADGEFPKVWKSAKVSALFKGGDKSQKDNYRPISILPTICKIIERSAHVQLCTYLEQDKLLSQSQFFPPEALNIYRPSWIYRSNPREHGQGARNGSSVFGFT